MQLNESKRRIFSVEAAEESGEEGRERIGWKGMILSIAAIAGEELLRRWLRGRRGGGRGEGRGRKGKK
jgi:hypothetical protein